MPPQRQQDPTLPRPWELLFDPASGLKYYWNPTTNVTQYERPAGGPPPPVLPAPGAPIAAYVSVLLNFYFIEEETYTYIG